MLQFLYIQSDFCYVTAVFSPNKGCYFLSALSALMSAQGALPVTDLFNKDEMTEIHQVSLGDDSQMSLKLKDCSQTFTLRFQQ